MVPEKKASGSRDQPDTVFPFSAVALIEIRRGFLSTGFLGLRLGPLMFSHAAVQTGFGVFL